MITNAEYLIQKFSEAREKMDSYPSKDSGFNYWRGIMDTYHNLLSLSFPGLLFDFHAIQGWLVDVYVQG